MTHFEFMDEVIHAYAGRPYHNFGHVLRMFDIARDRQIRLTVSQRIAITFHDIVCEPGRKDNEQRSARKMMDMCSDMHVTEKHQGMDILLEAYDMIMCTRDHMPTCKLAALVCDLDLYDLGTGRYRENSVKIRAEYWQTSDEEFYIGREKWLDMMLHKDKIYHSPDVPKDHEKQARLNMQDECDSIEALLTLAKFDDDGMFVKPSSKLPITAPNADGVVQEA